MMPNEKNGIFLAQVRSWLSDFRCEMNKLIGDYLQRIDELEVRISKEEISQPKVRIDGDDVIELELKGRQDAR
jgi:hypothetical protein